MTDFTILPRPAVPSLFGGLGQMLRRAARINETRRVLNALSDEMLEDIGLSRDQIDHIAERTA